jgi:hypothetical protein
MNDEMPNDEGMPKEQSTKWMWRKRPAAAAAHSSFGLRHFFVIRALSFDICGRSQINLALQ